MEQAQSILISGIQNKIEKKIKALGLSPKITPVQFFGKHGTHKHRYFSPCSTQAGKIIAFYARCHNNLDAQEKFIRESRFLKRVKEKDIFLNNFIPPIIAWGKEESFEWMVRKYIEGSPIGHSRRIAASPSLKNIERIAQIITLIAKTKTITFKGLNLKKFKISNYLLKSAYQELAQKGIITPSTSQQIIGLTKKALPLLKQENRYLSQGDLNLGNIIVDQKSKTWIIDWELVSINNFAYDVGYIWAHLWQAKKETRNKLLELYLNKVSREKLAKFKKFLPVIACYLALGGVKMKQSKENQKGLKKRRAFYQQLLENSTKSFSQLIKT